MAEAAGAVIGTALGQVAGAEQAAGAEGLLLQQQGPNAADVNAAVASTDAAATGDSFASALALLRALAGASAAQSGAAVDQVRPHTHGRLSDRAHSKLDKQRGLKGRLVQLLCG